MSRAAEQFHDLVSRERVTVLNQTPSAFHEFIQADVAVAEAVVIAVCVMYGVGRRWVGFWKPWIEH